MAIAKKELVSCKAHQHLTLYRLEVLRRIIKNEIDDSNMSWPGYTWYFDGTRIVVGAFGYEYEKEGNVVRNTGCYFREIFRTVRQRDAVFAVEFFRSVFNAPCSSRHNWNPRGRAYKLQWKANVGLKKRPTRVSSDTSSEPAKLTICERTGKPNGVSVSDWLLLLSTFGYGKPNSDGGWNPSTLPISCFNLWCKFEEWIEDVDRFNMLALDGYEQVLEDLTEFAQDDNTVDLANKMALVVKDIKGSIMCGYGNAIWGH